MIRMLPLIALLAPALLIAEQTEHLPAYVLQVPESVPVVLVAETDTSTLHLFTSSENGLQDHDERYMSVGQNGVGKERAWDRRTPLGIYFIDEQLDTSGLHERYGPMAFPLDYPNVWDRINERSGDGIWIHGVAPNGGRRPPLDTDGCIALPNDELLALAQQLIPLVTPVIIAREIRWTGAEQIALLRTEINDALEAWAESQRAGDLYGYLSLYADDFSYHGMNRGEWAAYRLHAMNSAVVQGISLQDVLLLADPEDDGLYLSRFRQSINDDGRTIITIKRLYWRRTEGGQLKIVAEDNG